MPLLPSDYVALLGCVLLGLLLSLGVLSKRRWVNAVSYVIAVAVFAVHVGDARLEYLWLWICPHPAAAMLEFAAVWGPLIAILIGLARYIKRIRDRRALYFLTLILAGYGVYLVGRQLIDPGVAATSEWRGEVLMQSTGSTCVAAATCTYLRTLGVDLSERDAVRRGLISHHGGSLVQTWRIMRLSLPADWRVRAAPLSREEMAASGHWYVVLVRLNIMVGHAVAIKLSSDGKTVTVRDPNSGEYPMAWERFAESWFGVGAWAERPGSVQGRRVKVQVARARLPNEAMSASNGSGGPVAPRVCPSEATRRLGLTVVRPYFPVRHAGC